MAKASPAWGYREIANTLMVASNRPLISLESCSNSTGA
jgi:hypothetical protein